MEGESGGSMLTVADVSLAGRISVQLLVHGGQPDAIASAPDGWQVARFGWYAEALWLLWVQ